MPFWFLTHVSHASKVKRLKELEAENTKLKKLLVEQVINVATLTPPGKPVDETAG